jgi:hypothetical protein
LSFIPGRQVIEYFRQGNKVVAQFEEAEGDCAGLTLTSRILGRIRRGAGQNWLKLILESQEPQRGTVK